MAAPRRVKVTLPDVDVSAYILPVQDWAGDNRPTCKTCVPKRTKMRHILTVAVVLQDGVESYAVFDCGNCGTQWAITWLQQNETVAKNVAKN